MKPQFTRTIDEVMNAIDAEQWPRDVDDTPYDHVANLLNNACPMIRDTAFALGLEITPTHVMWTEEALAYIEAFATMVWIEYETRCANIVWEAFALGSDDDVDYNGGYLEALCNALRKLM
jgi:hypothetical protein